MRWRRGARIPDEARATLPLRAGEKVLAAARDTRGGWVVATDAALVGSGLRIAWIDIAHARWLADESVLVLDPVSGASRRVGLSAPDRVPEAVHERVMASIVVSRRLTLSGGTGLLVVGRRATTGELLWQAVPDGGVDPDDPDVRREVDDMVRQLRGELGE